MKKENIKTRLFLIIGIVAALLVVAAVVITLSYRNSDTYRHARQVELGEKYLLELDYEQAIVEFLHAIEIDHRNPQGYIGAAEAYAALGLYEEALAILTAGYEATGSAEIWELTAKYEAIVEELAAAVREAEEAAATAAATDTDGQGDGQGTEPGEPWTERREYDDGSYDIHEYDAAGKRINSIGYNPDGSVRRVGEYDAGGNTIKNTWYNPDGTVHQIGEFDAAGNNIKDTLYLYNPDGTVDFYQIHEYDAAGDYTGYTEYNPDGTKRSFQ